MKSPLFFDFTVNKATNQVIVTRDFGADIKSVWSAFTEASILDQWWAPKPWVSKTKSMNFTEGGTRIYAMCGPAGEVHWNLQRFTRIDSPNSFDLEDAFTDENGNIITTFPTSTWNLVFKQSDDVTNVTITITHKKLADLEQIIAMGFREGFCMTLNELDKMLRPAGRTQITIDTTISAPAQKVWEYYTQGNHITKWNFASPDWHCPSSTVDLRPGGKMKSRMEAKDGSFGFDFEVTLDVVVAPILFAYTMADGRKAEALFIEQDGKTRATITFDAETQNSPERQKEGWGAILENFRKYTESH